jgi:hypothetical protein
MTEPSAGAVSSATAPKVAVRASARRRGKFYAGSAIVLLSIVAVGFSPTFYLRAAFDAPELPWPVFFHGTILTAWFAAFAVQAALVSANRTDVHRILGWIGAAVGVAVVVSGGTATVDRVSEVAAAGNLESIMPIGSLIVSSNIAGLTAFAVLLIAAITFRRSAETHKRLMLLTSMSIIQPAFARIFRWPVFDAPGTEGIMLAVAASFVLAGTLIVYDIVSRKSPHPATLAGAAVFIGLKLCGILLLAPSELGRSVVRAIAS